MSKLDLLLQIKNQIDHFLMGRKVIELRKDELGGKAMTEFVGLRAKTYSYLIDDGREDKGAQKSVSSKENVNLNFITFFWKWLKLIIKQVIQNIIKSMQIVLQKILKNNIIIFKTANI